MIPRFMLEINVSAGLFLNIRYKQKVCFKFYKVFITLCGEHNGICCAIFWVKISVFSNYYWYIEFVYKC